MTVDTWLLVRSPSMNLSITGPRVVPEWTVPGTHIVDDLPTSERAKSFCFRNCAGFIGDRYYKIAQEVADVREVGKL